MSKTESEPKKKRKTRLKGTDTRKPCNDCGQTKDRFKDFKPRWAGCEKHRTEQGRRYYQPGCTDCDAKVNGNIRQPRCADCDRARSKKKPKASTKAAAKPTPTQAAAVVVDPKRPRSPRSETWSLPPRTDPVPSLSSRLW